MARWFMDARKRRSIEHRQYVTAGLPSCCNLKLGFRPSIAPGISSGIADYNAASTQQSAWHCFQKVTNPICGYKEQST